MIPLLTDKYADIDAQTMIELENIFSKFEPLAQIFEVIFQGISRKNVLKKINFSEKRSEHSSFSAKNYSFE